MCQEHFRLQKRHEAGAGRALLITQRQVPAPPFLPGASFLICEEFTGKPTFLITVLFDYMWEDVWFYYPPPRRRD